MSGSAVAGKVYLLEMLYSGERFIVLMKQLFPRLIFGRITEADRMILQRSPLDKQEVFPLYFHASLQFVRNIPEATLRAALQPLSDIL